MKNMIQQRGASYVGESGDGLVTTKPLHMPKSNIDKVIYFKSIIKIDYSMQLNAEEEIGKNIFFFFTYHKDTSYLDIRRLI